ncbi:MAG TPA: hypothetical protein VH165_31375, partial [Kofleriaceae bacterium]|nr:hypothetical protein [Kofleriaceae bacterium]
MVWKQRGMVWNQRVILMKKKLWIGVAAVLWVVSLFHEGDRCERALFAYGVDAESCPDGEVRQSAELAVDGARRGAKGSAEGSIDLEVVAHYT